MWTQDRRNKYSKENDSSKENTRYNIFYDVPPFTIIIQVAKLKYVLSSSLNRNEI